MKANVNIGLHEGLEQDVDVLEIFAIVSGSSGIIGGIGYLLKCFLDKRTVKLNHKLEVDREMTKKIHTYIEKYYMPLINSAGEAGVSLGKAARDENDLQTVISFYDLAQYFSTVSQIAEEWEGIFLGDLITERLLSRIEAKASSKITAEPEKYLSELDASYVRKAIKPYELLVNFKPKLNQDETLKTIFRKYVAWRHDKADDVLDAAKYLKCYASLFEFGINSCYESWYRRRPFRLSDEYKEIVKEELKEWRDKEKLINSKEINIFIRQINVSPKWKGKLLSLWDTRLRK